MGLVSFVQPWLLLFREPVRVFFGKCAIVLFRRAALAAFLMFRFAVTRCFLVVISASEQAS
jgi:hypothetical protein